VPVTIPQAAVRVDFPLHLPDHALASNTTVTKGSFVDDEAAFMYESGVRVYVRKWPPGGDALTFYSEQVAEPDGVGRLMDIGGNPAWVVEMNEQAEGFPPYAFVDISIGSQQVVLKWEGPAGDLVEIAKADKRSPQARAPGQDSTVAYSRRRGGAPLAVGRRSCQS